MHVAFCLRFQQEWICLLQWNQVNEFTFKIEATHIVCTHVQTTFSTFALSLIVPLQTNDWCTTSSSSATLN